MFPRPFRPFAAVPIAILAAALLLAPLSHEAQAKKKKRRDCDLTASGAACLLCKTGFETDRLKFAAYMKRAKEPKCFDDIGCMLKFREGMCTSTQMIMDGKMRVRDYETGAEVRARNAFFVVRSGVKTPHGYGIVAFSDRERAEAFSAGREGASVMDYEALTESKFADLVDVPVVPEKAGPKCEKKPTAE